MNVAVVVQSLNGNSDFLVRDETFVYFFTEVFERDGSLIAFRSVLEFSYGLEDQRFLFLFEFGYVGASHGPFNHCFGFFFVSVDIDFGHFLDQPVRFFFHLFPILLRAAAESVPFMLFLLRPVTDNRIIEPHIPQDLFQVAIHRITVSLKAVDHQPERLHAISDLNFFRSMQFGMSGAQPNQSLKGPDGDGEHFIFVDSLLMVIFLPEKIPQLGHEFNRVIGQFWVH